MTQRYFRFSSPKVSISFSFIIFTRNYECLASGRKWFFAKNSGHHLRTTTSRERNHPFAIFLHMDLLKPKKQYSTNLSRMPFNRALNQESPAKSIYLSVWKRKTRPQRHKDHGARPFLLQDFLVDTSVTHGTAQGIMTSQQGLRFQCPLWLN